MSIAQVSGDALPRAMAYAHALVDAGASVFSCRLEDDGDPIPPPGWQTISPSHRRVSGWKRGMALCAVTGVVFDVLDIDPRNGGSLSIKRLIADLGDDGPDTLWKVRTPSGGLHIYVSPLGIGSHPGFLPGLDLKGGKLDGSSRGFVFIPPTVRPSKDPARYGERLPYTATAELTWQGAPCAALADYVQEAAAAKESGSGRSAATGLRAAVLAAGAGGQRAALLLYVHELERRGYDPDDIVALCASLELRAYDPRRPWTTGDFRGLLHRPGSVIGDATADEVSGIMGPRKRSGLRPLLAVESELTRWIWYRYLAVGDMSIVDADPGTGKSLMSLDVAARYTRGHSMPGEDDAIAPAGNVLLLAPEDRPSVIRARFDAAGGDLSRAFIPHIDLIGKGKARKAALDGQLLTFPDGVMKFREWIVAEDIGIVVIDPVAAFLSEDVNSHNDASVRRALEPLAYVLGENNCSAWLIRHLNKDTKKDIRYRGSGSVAFGAVSRVQLFAAPLPSDVGVTATHGLAQVKNNHLAHRPDDVLTYRIIDSPIVADDQGSYVPIIEWHGSVTLSIDRLSGDGSGVGGRRGPEPWAQTEVEEVLAALFDIKDEWSAMEIRRQLKEAGVAAVGPVVQKVKKKLQIHSFQRFDETAGRPEWIWTSAKPSVGSSSGAHYDGRARGWRAKRRNSAFSDDSDGVSDGENANMRSNARPSFEG